MYPDLPAAMAALGAGVTRVRVIDSGVVGGRALGDTALAEFTGEEATALVTLLAIEQPTREFYCMCRGHPAIELWVGDRRQVTVGLHHGISVRVDGWWSDAPLVDGEQLLRWLAERGVTEPLESLLEAREGRRQDAIRREAWLARAPEVLRPRLPALEAAPGGFPRLLRSIDDDARAAAELVREALGAAAARTLLAWYGAPGGPWSGYPGHETVAEALIGCLPIAEVIAAGDTDDSTVLFGLARFLARHGAPRSERARVGEELRRRLRGVPAIAADEDMRTRLDAALQDTPEPAGSATELPIDDVFLTCENVGCSRPDAPEGRLILAGDGLYFMPGRVRPSLATSADAWLGGALRDDDDDGDADPLVGLRSLAPRLQAEAIEGSLRVAVAEINAIAIVNLDEKVTSLPDGRKLSTRPFGPNASAITVSFADGRAPLRFTLTRWPVVELRAWSARIGRSLEE